MIKDRLKHAENYYNISENLKLGLEWLKSQDLKNLKPDVYCINGEEFYANLQTYDTKEDAKYETHRKYIDIQYMIDGSELVGVCDISDCNIYESYNEVKDIEFWDKNSDDEYCILNEGDFLVLFPNDAHKPSISNKIKRTVKKVVVKVPLN